MTWIDRGVMHPNRPMWASRHAEEMNPIRLKVLLTVTLFEEQAYGHRLAKPYTLMNN